ncbi:hypothetical protein FACS189443_6000 [Planctomycetales bacterium]|nr:hypothetical protein FACS189443_6000 [Planctomycetales bacterium]
MMLSELTLTATAPAAADESKSRVAMTFKALLKDSAVLPKMENAFQDKTHSIKTGERSEVSGNEKYRFRCNASISLKAEEQ